MLVEISFGIPIPPEGALAMIIRDMSPATVDAVKVGAGSALGGGGTGGVAFGLPLQKSQQMRCSEALWTLRV